MCDYWKNWRILCHFDYFLICFYFHLAASGSVYTWGGGSDGQLGFGKTSTYLAEPRCLPKSAFKGPVSQIACGESYSAAVTGKWVDTCHRGKVGHWHLNPDPLFACV